MLFFVYLIFCIRLNYLFFSNSFWKLLSIFRQVGIRHTDKGSGYQDAEFCCWEQIHSATEYSVWIAVNFDESCEHEWLAHFAPTCFFNFQKKPILPPSLPGPRESFPCVCPAWKTHPKPLKGFGPCHSTAIPSPFLFCRCSTMACTASPHVVRSAFNSCSCQAPPRGGGIMRPAFPPNF